MYFAVAFPPSMTGLVGTVGYAQIKTDGTVAVARTTVGIVENGHGGYGVTVTPDATAVLIEWDSGGASPMYAHENIAGSLTTEDTANIWSNSKALTVGKFLGLK